MKTAKLFLVASCALMGCSKSPPPVAKPAPHTLGDVVVCTPTLMGKTPEDVDRIITLAVAKDESGLDRLMFEGRMRNVPRGVQARIISQKGDAIELKFLKGAWAGQYWWADAGKVFEYEKGNPNVEKEEEERRDKIAAAEAASAAFTKSMTGIKGLKVIRVSCQEYQGELMRFAHLSIGQQASREDLIDAAERAYAPLRNHFRTLDHKGLTPYAEISIYAKAADEMQGRQAALCTVVTKGKESLPPFDESLIEWPEKD